MLAQDWQIQMTKTIPRHCAGGHSHVCAPKVVDMLLPVSSASKKLLTGGIGNV